MRITNTSPNTYHINQRNNQASKNLFESTLFLQTIEKKSEETNDKSEEKKGKLVTTREGAYVRQYLVNSDCSRVLISEVKQSENHTSYLQLKNLAPQ